MKNMVEKRNISIEKKHINMLKPFIEKNNNNFSAAIRDTIEIAAKAIEKYDTKENAIKNLSLKDKEKSELEKSISSGKNVVLPSVIFTWMLKYIDGVSLDKDIINELLDPLDLRTITDIDNKIKELIEFYGWDCEVSIYAPDILNPEKITIIINCDNKIYRKFMAHILVMFFVYNRNYDIKIIHERATSIRIDLISSETSKKAIECFGYMNQAMAEFLNKKDFWRCLIEMYIILNYNLIAIPKEYCKSMKLDNITPDIKIFEKLSNNLISEIPHRDFLKILKNTQKAMNLIDTITIYNNNIVKIGHNYNIEHAKQLTEYYISLLKANGHEYESTTTTTSILLTHICCSDDND